MRTGVARGTVAHAGILRRHPAVRAALRLALATVIVGLVVWFVLIPEFQAGRHDMQRLFEASPVLVALAVVAEAASLLCFSLLSRGVLGRSVRFPRLVAIDLADLAVNHTLPGGGATAAAFRFRLLRDNGVSARRAMSVATVETVVSNSALVIVFLGGVLGSLGRATAGATVWIAVAVAVGLALGGALALWSIVRRRERWTRAAAAIERRLHRITPGRLTALVTELADTLVALTADRRRGALAALAAFGNWLLDALALWIVVAMFGAPVDPGTLLLAYGLAQLLAQLPLTPGGLGLVEGASTIVLAAAGVPHGVALLGVLGWRVLEFWVPVPVGWLCYLGLRASALSPSRRRAASSRATTSSS